MISTSVLGIRLAFAAAVIAPAGALIAWSRLLPPIPAARSVASMPADGEAVIRAMHDKYAKSWYR
ncbi:MAG TPA: hypothetical protein VK511_13285, partial [Gemmatimonadaceae bacterium]|nr:hypothetical protein [Gemmatimonadaceae bacterium]